MRTPFTSSGNPPAMLENSPHNSPVLRKAAQSARRYCPTTSASNRARTSVSMDMARLSLGRARPPGPRARGGGRALGVGGERSGGRPAVPPPPPPPPGGEGRPPRGAPGGGAGQPPRGPAPPASAGGRGLPDSPPPPTPERQPPGPPRRGPGG